MSILECKKVTLCYQNKPVVKDLSFRVEPGEIVGIVGENGSGKSTLLKGLLGLKKPDGGEIVYGVGCTPKTMGYLPQQSEADTAFPATVSEVVHAGLVGRKSGLFWKKEDHRQVADTLEKLDMKAYATHPFARLSGGQQQRVLLARALVGARSMLILDEPVTGLDPRAAAMMYRCVKEQNRARNMAVLMVSHDVDGVLGLADKILHLAHNDAFFGTVEEYLLSPFGKGFLEGGSLCG